MELILATTNLHKILEIRSILKKSFSLDYLSLRQFPDYFPPEETGATFEENAILKALSAASFFRKWSLAEDSGLVVPALQNEPGIHSARYAGENATDRENLSKLITSLESLDREERVGYYISVCVLVSPEKEIVKVAQGTCEGTLLTSPRGNQGFGYDPIFLKNGYGKTFAELHEDTKNRISHRSKALEKCFPVLESLLHQNPPSSLPPRALPH